MISDHAAQCVIAFTIGAILYRAAEIALYFWQRRQIKKHVAAAFERNGLHVKAL